MPSPSRQPGRSGGRRVARPFEIIHGDRDRWPDESRKMTDHPTIVTPADYHMSWAWAVTHLKENPSHWLKVPLGVDDGSAEFNRQVNVVRSSVWRASNRLGISLESCEWQKAIWFRTR